MQKQKKHALFSLIKSLTPSEKRYFKIFASKHIIGEMNLYVRLFDLIDQQKAYDEKSILLHEKRIKKSFIRNLKKYLYGLILKSLTSHHHESSIEVRIHKMVHETEILYTKGLYDQCKTKLLKAKRLAYDHEKLYLIPEILNLQSKILNWETPLLKMEEQHDLLAEEYNVVLEKTALVKRYETTKEKIYLLSGKYVTVRSKSDLNKITSIIKACRTENESSLPFYAASSYYASLGLFYTITNNPVKGSVYFKKQIALLDSKPKIRAEEPLRYISANQNLLVALSQYRNFKEQTEVLDKLKNLHKLFPEIKKSKTLQAAVFIPYCTTWLSIYNLTGEFEKGKKMIPVVEKEMLLYEALIGKGQMMTICYNFAHIYFALADYKRAITWLNKILVVTNSSIRYDALVIGRIFNLIIQYELGNRELLKRMIVTDYKFVLKKEGGYKSEIFLLTYLERLANSNTRKETSLVLNEMRIKIELLKRDPFEKYFLNIFDFQSWIESKIRNLTYSEAVKQKYYNIEAV